MSERDDLAEAQFLHPTERAESEWLLAREHDPRAPPPSPEIAADYAVIEDLLGSLPAGPSDEGWQEDVWRALSASIRPASTPLASTVSPPWWRTPVSRWSMGGALVAAAAVIVLILLPRAPELEVTTSHIGAMRGASDEVVVGDHLVVTARPREVGDLRVYRSDGMLVARCPNGPGCRNGSREEQTIEITLDAPVQYQVILVDGGNALPDGAMDAYVDAARAANARIIMYPPIDVH